jgi:ABC-type antimicrobial peptide transport system permease subunit
MVEIESLPPPTMEEKGEQQWFEGTPTTEPNSAPETVYVQGDPMGQFTQTNATLALILSIVGIIVTFTLGCGVLLAIPAVIIANGALTITNGQPGHPDSGSAKAAQVISWINIALTIIGIIFIIAIFAFFGSIAAMG